MKIDEIGTLKRADFSHGESFCLLRIQEECLPQHRMLSKASVGLESGTGRDILKEKKDVGWNGQERNKN